MTLLGDRMNGKNYLSDDAHIGSCAKQVEVEDDRERTETDHDEEGEERSGRFKRFAEF